MYSRLLSKHRCHLSHTLLLPTGWIYTSTQLFLQRALCICIELAHTHTWMHSSATPQISGCSYLCGACADRSYICYLSLVISLGDGGSGILVLFFSWCFICFHHTFLWCVCSFFCMYATFDMPQQESRQMGQPWQPGINNALFSTDEVCSLKVSDSCETCLLYYS